MRVKNIKPSIRSEGIYIGERVTLVELEPKKDCDCEEQELDDLATEIITLNHTYKIDSIVLAGNPLAQTGELLELIEYIAEKNKITIETDGTELIPQQLIKKNNIYISIKANLDDDYEIRTLEKNTLNFFKAKYWNYEVKFGIGADVEDDIKRAIDLLSKLYRSKYTDVVFYPEPDNLEVAELIERCQKIANYCRENEIPISYDVRVLLPMHHIVGR